MRALVFAPADVVHERRRLERVAERLNGEFAGLLRLETTYEPSGSEDYVPRDRDFHIVLAILWSRLSDGLPAESETQLDPADAADELLSAVSALAGDHLPSMFIFRKTKRPRFPIDDAVELERARKQWTRLELFFEGSLIPREGHVGPAVFNFESTDEFETKAYSVLQQWVEQHVPGSRAPSWSIALNGSPFPGLAAFEPEHAPVFFGRAKETAQAIGRFTAAAKRRAAFLLVLGTSGVGKSSLVRAGIIPRLTSPGVVHDIDAWRLALMRPGAKPIEALAHALLSQPSKGLPGALPELAEGDQPASAQLAGLLRRDGEAAVAAIRHALEVVGIGERRHGRQCRLRAALLLVLDELDDLFAADVSAADRADFCKLMRVLAASGVVWIAATLRAGLLEVLLDHDDLKKLKETGADYDLTMPGPTQVAEIVRGPAAAAGLTFEAQEESLDARVLRDFAAAPSLPQLQFTLQRLFAERQLAGSERRLTYAAYTDVGGIAGAIDHVAERAISGLDANAIAALPGLLHRLVTTIHRPTPRLTGCAPIAPRTAMLAELDAPTRRLVDALVNARVLVHSIERGVPTIRLAHLDVLEHWQRARAIMAAEVGGRRPVAPPARSRERFFAAAAAALAALAVLAGWLYFDARQGRYTAEQLHNTALVDRDQADRERGIAEQREQEARELRDLSEARGKHAAERAQLAEAGREEAVERVRRAEAEREQALKQAQLAEARRTEAEDARAVAQQQQRAAEARAQATGQQAVAVHSRLLTALADQKYRSGDHVTSALLALEALSAEPHGDRPSEAQHSLARLWRSWEDERIPRERSVLDGASGPVLACALSRTGSRVAIGAADGIVHLWDAEAGVALARLEGHSENPVHVSFDPEGTKLVSAAADGLRVRDAATGAQIAWFPEPRRLVAVSSDAKLVISSSAPNRLHVWDASAEREIIRTVPGSVLAIRVGAEGARVLVATAGGSIELYDAVSGRWLRSFRGHVRKVLSAAFSPDGLRIVSLGEDQTARIWSTAGGRQLFSVYDQRLTPSLLPRLTNEHVLIPFSFGFRLYAIQAARVVAELPAAGETSVALVSPDAAYIITLPSTGDHSGSAKQARLWDTATGKPSAILHEGTAITCASINQDGRMLLTADRDGLSRLWSFERPGPVASPASGAAMIEASKVQVPRCLTRAQRETALLEIEPPAWCIEREKWPYHTQAWKDWLRYKRENAGPPMPDTPEWRAWLAYRAITAGEPGP